jgi:hypothetical protein
MMDKWNEVVEEMKRVNDKLYNIISNKGFLMFLKCQSDCPDRFVTNDMSRYYALLILFKFISNEALKTKLSGFMERAEDETEGKYLFVAGFSKDIFNIHHDLKITSYNEDDILIINKTLIILR